jgi:hypothetical protein
MFAAITATDIFIFWLIFGVIIAGLALLAWFSWRLNHRNVDPSPYTGSPLRRGSDISDYSADKIYRFMHQLQQFDNPMFDLKKASYCIETGRLFPNSVTWLDSIKVDWNFLQKRYKGHYVSWGSLTDIQQAAIRREHGPLSGFNTEFSSSTSQPRLVEPEFAFAKPGPLYIDINTHILLGWKQVPGTEFEVLIVQKPLNLIMQKSE